MLDEPAASRLSSETVRYFREVETDEFMQPYELTKVLAEVLRDEKTLGHILVKYEKKEHCFHITSCIR